MGGTSGEPWGCGERCPGGSPHPRERHQPRRFRPSGMPGTRPGLACAGVVAAACPRCSASVTASTVRRFHTVPANYLSRPRAGGALPAGRAVVPAGGFGLCWCGFLVCLVSCLYRGFLPGWARKGLKDVGVRGRNSSGNRGALGKGSSVVSPPLFVLWCRACLCMPPGLLCSRPRPHLSCGVGEVGNTRSSPH